MNARSTYALALVAVVSLAGTACDRDLDPLEPAPFPTDAAVFVDGFGPTVQFEAFLGTNQAGGDPESFVIDETETFRGSSSIRIKVPAAGDPAGSFAGGVLVSGVPRDLSGYDALTFWARASSDVTLDLVGLGNDNTGTSRFGAETTGIQLNTAWRKVIVPIPLARKLTKEAGLFTFADGADGGAPYTIWFDEIQYESTGLLANARPSIPTETVVTSVGSTEQIEGTQVVFDVNGADQTIGASPSYFTFSSSDESVATVDADGVVSIVGEGTAEITATLGSTTASGVFTVTTDVSGSQPAAPAPAPTQAEADVISMFSDVYTDVTVDTWSASYDDADLEDITISGDAVKKYTNLVFAAAEATSSPIDATSMTDFHMDIWTPDATADPVAFRVKLVDFGPDGAFDGGDDSEHELTFTATTTPALTTGAWISLDVPLSDFAGLAERGHIAQLIISGDINTVFVDNVFFYDSSGGGGSATEPAAPAPAPTQAEADVISMFSDVYTDVTVDTWSASYDDADLEDITISGDAVKKYTNLVFAAAEATSSPIDATSMTDFHMDIWTPDATADPVAFRVKLVDFGPDGAFDGGDDSEHELTFTATTTPALTTGAWISLDVPLSDFAGLAERGHIAQLIISGDINTVFVDNVFFYDSSGGGGSATEPAAPAPAPTQAEADVISMFSDVYTDVTVDTWSASYDDADLEDITISGDAVKKYTNLVFAAAEATSSPIDATSMTDFHMDIWTPDATADPVAFRVKLVDFGPDGAFDGGDDSEHELTFTATTTPALTTGAWISLDVPLSDFAGLAERGHIAQLIISGDINTVFVDNVFFYDSSGGGGSATEPAAPAPAPTQAEADVISMFSDVYTDVTVDTWSASYDDADLEDITISGDAVKKYTNLVFAAAEATSSPIDATSMTDFHMDIWTPDATADPVAFRVKLVDFGPDGAFDGGDDSEHELTFTATTTPALTTGAWISLDVPLSDFAGLAERGHIAQLIISGDINTVFVDNVFFYDSSGGGGSATEPAAPAPAPTQAEADVISMFSDVYTDVTVDTWSASYDDADLEDITISGDAVKKYTNLVFAAAEATSSPIDATSMTDFHMDIWTPDATADPVAFRVKLVDFGPDGAFDGGDDSEHELTFTATTTPALTTGAWISLDVPLSDFAGLAERGHIAQLIISGDINTVFVDNVFFYK